MWREIQPWEAGEAIPFLWVPTLLQLLIDLGADKQGASEALATFA